MQALWGEVAWGYLKGSTALTGNVKFMFPVFLFFFSWSNSPCIYTNVDYVNDCLLFEPCRDGA